MIPTSNEIQNSFWRKAIFRILFSLIHPLVFKSEFTYFTFTNNKLIFIKSNCLPRQGIWTNFCKFPGFKYLLYSPCRACVQRWSNYPWTSEPPRTGKSRQSLACGYQTQSQDSWWYSPKISMVNCNEDIVTALMFGCSKYNNYHVLYIPLHRNVQYQVQVIQHRKYLCWLRQITCAETVLVIISRNTIFKYYN